MTNSIAWGCFIYPCIFIGGLSGCPSICQSGSSERKPPKIAKKRQFELGKIGPLLVHNWMHRSCFFSYSSCPFFFSVFDPSICLSVRCRSASFYPPVHPCWPLFVNIMKQVHVFLFIRTQFIRTRASFLGKN